jgi:hypothetical protein
MKAVMLEIRNYAAKDRASVAPELLFERQEAAWRRQNK